MPFRQVDGLQSENSANLVGKGHLFGREVPLPPANMREALRLGQIYLASAQRPLSSFAFGALLGLSQGALYRWREPRQSCLQNIVRRAAFERFDRQVLANRAGHKNERYTGTSGEGGLKSGKPVVRWQSVVRKDQIETVRFERCQKFVFCLRPGDFERELIGQKLLDKLRVIGIVLKQQN